MQAIRSVSIVIPNWNGRQILAECLQSIEEASADLGFELETIVVDNWSVDDSVEMVRTRFPKVRLLANRENQGFARAVNRGIRESTGDTVIILNNDILFPFESLKAFLARYEAIGGAAIAAPTLVGPNGEEQHCSGLYPWRKPLLWFAPFLRVFFPAYDYLPCACLAVRRSTLNDIGLLDERFFFYAEDADFSKRIRDVGGQVVLIDDVNVIHHHGATTNKAGRERFLVQLDRADLGYIAKHHTGWGLTLYRWAKIIITGIRASKWLILRAYYSLSGRLDKAEAADARLKHLGELQQLFTGASRAGASDRT